MNPSDPDPLDQLAAQWREDTSSKPELRRRVWTRIAAAEEARPARRFGRWVAALQLVWRQRALAGFVVACVLVGVVSAEMRATRTPIQDVGRVATMYLQAINPLLRSGAGATP